MMSQVFIEWLNKHGHNFGPFIDGECIKSRRKGGDSIISDKSNNISSEVETCLELTEISVVINEDLIVKSIKSSENALTDWRNNLQRGRILHNVCSALKSKSELFAEISLATHGICKTYSVKTDLSYAIRAFSYYGNWSNKLQYSYNRWQANGVIGCAFLDDSSPLMALSWLSASLLAAGNTIILLVKPHYSLISLAFAITLSEAGLPPGVLNVLPCVDNDSFPTIMDKISRLTGIFPSTIKSLPFHVHVSSVIKKNIGVIPMLVLTSADVESAVQCIMDTVKIPTLIAWYTNLILVEEPIFESFVAALKIRLDDFADCPNEHESKFQYGKFIAEKRKDGFEVLKLSKDYACCLFLINSDDAITCPVIEDDLHPPVRVISIILVRTVEEAVSFANHPGSGLAASVWTNDSGQALSIPFKLKYGTVWVNTYGEFDVAVPFSPWNSYGFGTFSGDKVLLHNMHLVTNDANSRIKKHGLYSNERNDVFPKRNVQNAIDSAHSNFLSLHKLQLEDREGNFLQLTAAQLEKFWQSHYKAVLTETTDETFCKIIRYVEYWSTHVDDSSDETVFTKDFYVLCKKEPVGVVGIVTGCAPLDTLIYLICGAVLYGNAVVVGLPNDEKTTTVLALEMENMFSLITERVSFVISDSDDLWDTLQSNERCSVIWYVQDCVKRFPKANTLKQITAFKVADDMRSYSDMLKIHCTKQKCIWLPRI